jgi:two-component system phosphate regulon response regulator PhoB
MKKRGSRPHALIVEDDRAIAKLIAYNLDGAGFDSRRVTTGEQALHSVGRKPTELIVLDLALPGVDGLTVCRRLKDDAQTRAIPVLIVSARGEEEDVIAGLEIGADDYITKPFSPRVLVARARALLRRLDPLGSTADGSSGESEPGAPVAAGPIRIDPRRHEATVADTPLKLTATEFRTLLFLTERAGWVSSRSRIVTGVHGADYPVTDRSVDVIIASLRKKLGDEAWRLETVRGVGFRLRE